MSTRRRHFLKWLVFGIGSFVLTKVIINLWKAWRMANLEEVRFEFVSLNDKGEEITRQKGSARTFVEVLDHIRLEMVFIPSGQFQMGGLGWGVVGEDSIQYVTLPSFFIGRYTVTQAQYEAIMGVNPSLFKG
jgi:eukaryotic-like serine/threonine-protein kinase